MQGTSPSHETSLSNSHRTNRSWTDACGGTGTEHIRNGGHVGLGGFVNYRVDIVRPLRYYRKVHNQTRRETVLQTMVTKDCPAALQPCATHLAK